MRPKPSPPVVIDVYLPTPAPPSSVVIVAPPHTVLLQWATFKSAFVASK
jgi:hypothetical protein